MERRSTVILLNGVGSVGKSATAQALQQVAEKPFLHVMMDTFLDMLPASLVDHPDGMLFRRSLQNGRPSVAIQTGPVVDRLMAGMRHAIAAMAAQGNDLIIDEVLIEEGDERAYRDVLVGCDLRLVGLFSPLDVLEAREQRRGDRQIGLAR